MAKMEPSPREASSKTSDARAAPKLRSDGRHAKPIDKDGVFEFSASAIKTHRGCEMQYAFTYSLGLRPPDTAANILGKHAHTHLENWLLKAKMPPSDKAGTVARRLLPFLPLPSHPNLKIEHGFRALFPVGAARGFIDVLVTQPDLKKMPPGYAWDASIPAVIDHKTTSRIDYALTPEDLLLDPQGVLYGAAARLEAARELGGKTADIPYVDLNWNYSSTKADKTERVIVRQSLAILEDGLGQVLKDAEEMKKVIEAGEDRVKDMRYNLNACTKYNGCAHQSRCPAYMRALFAGNLPNKNDLDLSNDSVWTASIPAEEKAMTTQSEILKKLREKSRIAPKVQEVPSAAPNLGTQNPNAGTAAAKVEGSIKVTPEPDLPTPDLSGLDTPIPAGTSPIVPPDAAPDVTPEDPPAPAVEPAEPVAASEAAAAGTEAKPKKRGRPRKVQPDQRTDPTLTYNQPAGNQVLIVDITPEEATALKAAMEESTASADEEELPPLPAESLKLLAQAGLSNREGMIEFLTAITQAALAQNRFMLAQNLTMALTVLQSGG